MSSSLILLIGVALALPVAWLVAEFKCGRRARIAVGILAVCSVAGVTCLGTAISTELNKNLESTEKIDSLLEVFDKRMQKEAKDTPLAADVAAFSDAYAISYEDGRFWELMKQHLDKAETEVKEQPTEEGEPTE